ncbi:hypothetical protein COY14_02715 [Candidatus Roizmanbacteria bacterium CG_4_10_14_0_2_um_filter_36_9]|uniref:Uncharacterized protein n=1 Tax=Candidatus Roizmanbacteria bacterium CG_4_10_14_0_2_um_filter_36_9 TaxID=1974823 RepID=A0A2M7U404_9BACT|nr:MAG: hypothetical protein COY14_02715 [Candidatus Roizmanbacteria bacterium CG_4_10_14_0_2_um_filter_36_9]
MLSSDDGRDDNGKDQERTGDGKFTQKSSFTSPLKPEVKMKSDINEPLFSFSINNPFKKILQWLEYVKKHNATKFDMKINVPLVALPVFFVGILALLTSFFGLGQFAKNRQIESLPTPTPVLVIMPTGTPSPYKSSFIGIIQSTYYLPSITPKSTDSTDSAAINGRTFETNRYILLDHENKITFLDVASTIQMDGYVGKRVLITGLYDPSAQSLQISKNADIEIIR